MAAAPAPVTPFEARAWKDEDGRGVWFAHNCPRSTGGGRVVVRLLSTYQTKVADDMNWLLWRCDDCGREGMTVIDGSTVTR